MTYVVSCYSWGGDKFVAIYPQPHGLELIFLP